MISRAASADRWLHYRAGPRALRKLQREGLQPGAIRAVFGQASGPRWLALAGLDRALLETGLLGGGRRTLLAGASAGAWRMATFACRDPLVAHRALTDRYIEQVFQRRERPADVTRAYRQMLQEILEPEIDHLLAHPDFDLAIHTARQRALRSRGALVVSLLAAAVLGPFTSRATRLLFDRVLFHSEPSRLSAGFEGRVVALTRDNILASAVASGAVPYYLAAVADPPGAPQGAYVDGGLTDCHLNHDYPGSGEGILLLPHFQRRIVPQWLDRNRPARTLASAMTADVLQIYPSRRFVADLPDGRLPDQNDFSRFFDHPEERIRRWRSVVVASERLGEELREDLDSCRLGELALPLR